MPAGTPLKKGSRSMTIPIALPHDGPLSHLILQNETLVSDEASISDEELLQKIVELDETLVDGPIIFMLSLMKRWWTVLSFLC
jgi:hypothetical protein